MRALFIDPSTFPQVASLRAWSAVSGVSIPTLRKYAAAGAIVHERIGATIAIRKDDFMDWAENYSLRRPDMQRRRRAVRRQKSKAT
jgi:hypothetical protein